MLEVLGLLEALARQAQLEAGGLKGGLELLDSRRQAALLVHCRAEVRLLLAHGLVGGFDVVALHAAGLLLHQQILAALLDDVDQLRLALLQQMRALVCARQVCFGLVYQLRLLLQRRLQRSSWLKLVSTL